MNTLKRVASLLTLVASSLLLAQTAFGAVSPEEAAKLKTTLTPLGAERAGNASGTIPAWDGGYTKTDPSYKDGGTRSDPFANEKRLYTITAQNMGQYANQLSEGVKAMLKKYPDTYHLDVYPTHRTAAAPQTVYDATFKNATQAKMVDSSGGPEPQNAEGGIPFPIPQSGTEAMWNHLARWRAASWHASFFQYLITADGKPVLTNDSRADYQMPWYLPKGVNNDGVYWTTRMVNDGPPLRAGEGIVGRENTDADK